MLKEWRCRTIINYETGVITYKFLRVARKSHTCEYCGCEIHKNEGIWWYKPEPEYFKLMSKRKGKKIYHKWRKRCEDHEPKSYAELLEIEAREQLSYYGGGF